MYILPDDIIILILLRLPAKSLFGFRLVCKSWFNLITRDHDFIKMHLLHQQQHEQRNHSILVFNFCSSTNRVLLHSINNNYNNCIHEDDNTTIVSSSSPPMYSNMHTNYDFMPLGFCNGLLCIYSSQKNVLLCEKICLWNPCTQEYKELPPSPPPLPLLPRTDYEQFILNGFINYGFGYDSINDDYKVVKNSYLDEITAGGRHRYGITVSVYTLGTNSWRRIGDLFPFVPHTWSTPGVFVDGALYWMASKPEPSMRTEIIICFQLGDEVYKEILFPPGVDVYEVVYDIVVLKELKGSLCVFQDKCTIGYHKNMVVWVMNKADEQYSWAKFFTIAIQDLSMLHPVEWFEPLGICNENDEILMKVEEKELVWFNLRDKKTRFLVAFPNEVSYVTIETHTTTESLVSLKTKSI